MKKRERRERKRTDVNQEKREVLRATQLLEQHNGNPEGSSPSFYSKLIMTVIGLGRTKISIPIKYRSHPIDPPAG